MTNNEAEYEALLAGLRMSKAKGAKRVEACSDSQLIVRQVSGHYEARDESMKEYLQAVKDMVTDLEHFSINHVPRSENSQADALSKLASSASCDNPRSVFWEVVEKRSVEKVVNVLDRTSTWMDGIFQYLLNGTLPDEKAEAQRIQKNAKSFEIVKGELFKKSYNRPYLKCVTPERGREVLDDLHQGLCSSHIGVRSLEEKAIRQGYFWRTL